MASSYLRIFGFPIFLLFFMVPIPAVIYNQLTFPLQLLASRVAEGAISLLQNSRSSAKAMFWNWPARN